MNPFKLVTGLVLSVAASLAIAIPLTTTGDSGYAGDPVTVVVTEPNPTGLFAVAFDISFDPSILTYVSGAAGNIGTFASVEGLALADIDTTSGRISASLAFPDPAITDDVGGSLLALTFNINGTAAPGETFINFNCFESIDPDTKVNLGCVDYLFKSVPATVTVLPPASTSIPIPGTFPLMGLGFAALLWTRRQRH